MLPKVLGISSISNLFIRWGRPKTFGSMMSLTDISIYAKKRGLKLVKMANFSGNIWENISTQVNKYVCVCVLDA